MEHVSFFHNECAREHIHLGECWQVTPCHPIKQECKWTLHLAYYKTLTIALPPLPIPLFGVSMVWPLALIAFHFVDCMQYGRHRNSPVSPTVAAARDPDGVLLL